jgi:hypothetical protein
MTDVNSKPGDLVGHNLEGQVVIDRRIPLPWMLGLVGAVALQAVLMYTKLENNTEKMADLTIEMKAVRASTSGTSERMMEHTMILREHERRLSEIAAQIENRKNNRRE